MRAKQPVTLRDVHKIKRWQKHDIWDRMQNAGVFFPGMPSRLGDKNGSYEGIINCWKNQTCYVIAGSISGSGFDLNKLDKCHTITVNHIVEAYTKSEMTFFMDQRFLRITKLDWNKYTGTAVYHNNNNWTPPNQKYYMIKTRNNNDKNIDLDINRGLFGRCLSGIAAVHIALITGAARIYLVGVGHHQSPGDGQHHIIKNYTGANNTKKSIDGYNQRQLLFNRFLPWKDRIVNCQNPKYPAQYLQTLFRTITLDEMPIVEERRK